MKKRILFMLAFVVLACMLCISVMAQEAKTYYLYDDGSELPEGEDNISVSELYWQSETKTGLFANLKDGDNIVIELKESISYTPTAGTMNNVPNSSNCLRISTAATVTVKFNGYSWWFTHDKAYDAFVVYNEGATLNLIGTKAKNPDGTIKELGTNYRGSEINENIDVYSDFVIAYIAGGKLHCENLAAFCTEESIYQKEGYVNGRAEIEFVDCSIYTNSSSMYTLAIVGKGNSNNSLRIDGGRYGSICVHNPLNDSYIKNATVKATTQSNALYIDSWKDRNAYDFPVENSTLDGRYWGEGDSNIIVAKNSKLGVLYLKGDSSGGASVELTDSTYTSVDFAGKSGSLTIYVSPDCVNAGTKTDYDKDNTAGKLDTTYDAPAIGHEASLDEIENVVYKSGYGANGTYICGCVRCDATGLEENGASAPKLITFKGFSTPKDGAISLVVGYEVDTDAVEAFEDITKKEFTYGIVAAVGKNLGANEPLDENGDVITLEKGSVVKTTVAKDATRYEFRLNNMKGYENEAIMLSTYTMFDGKITYLQGGEYTGLSTITYAEAPKGN